MNMDPASKEIYQMYSTNNDTHNLRDNLEQDLIDTLNDGGEFQGDVQINTLHISWKFQCRSSIYWRIMHRRFLMHGVNSFGWEWLIITAIIDGRWFQIYKWRWISCSASDVAVQKISEILKTVAPKPWIVTQRLDHSLFSPFQTDDLTDHIFKDTALIPNDGTNGDIRPNVNTGSMKCPWRRHCGPINIWKAQSLVSWYGAYLWKLSGTKCNCATQILYERYMVGFISLMLKRFSKSITLEKYNFLFSKWLIIVITLAFVPFHLWYGAAFLNVWQTYWCCCFVEHFPCEYHGISLMISNTGLGNDLLLSGNKIYKIIASQPKSRAHVPLLDHNILTI